MKVGERKEGRNRKDEFSTRAVVIGRGSEKYDGKRIRIGCEGFIR